MFYLSISKLFRKTQVVTHLAGDCLLTTVASSLTLFSFAIGSLAAGVTSVFSTTSSLATITSASRELTTSVSEAVTSLAVLARLEEGGVGVVAGLVQVPALTVVLAVPRTMSDILLSKTPLAEVFACQLLKDRETIRHSIEKMGADLMTLTLDPGKGGKDLESSNSNDCIVFSFRGAGAVGRC